MLSTIWNRSTQEGPTVKHVKGGAGIREISKVIAVIYKYPAGRKTCWLQAHDIHDCYRPSKWLLNRGSYIMANIKY